MRLPILATLALMLAACTPAVGPEPGPARAGVDCALLFQQFDHVEDTMSTPSGRRDRMVIAPALQLPALRLRQGGCISMSSDLAPMARLDAPAVVDGGRAIPPTRVHVGAVTSMSDDAAAQAFFEAHGAPATSVGSAALGRRIYVGPFVTEGALDGALALARAAGFASPYPARF